jgi:integrase
LGARGAKYLLPILDGVNAPDGLEAKRRIDNATKYANIWIKRIAERIGVDTSNLHFYSARHTGATALGQAGVNPRIIQEYLGHEDFKTTQMYLKKHSPGEVDEAVGVLRKG